MQDNDHNAHPPAAREDVLPADILLGRLLGVSQVGLKKWVAHCPAHADDKSSLSIEETGEYRPVVQCHSGCDTKSVLAAIGLEEMDLYPYDSAVCKAVQRKIRLMPLPPPVTADVPDDVVARMTAHAWDCCRAARYVLPALAEDLGLPLQALKDFCVGIDWDVRPAQWSFLERDHKGRMVGIMYRTQDGRERIPKGTRRGLIYARTAAAAANDPTAPLYIPQGHRDTIALHSAGCLAIGRPAAYPRHAVESWLPQLLLAQRGVLQQRPIVVIGGRDGGEAKETWLHLSRTCPDYKITLDERRAACPDLNAASAAAYGLVLPPTDGEKLAHSR
jgi:hypothetical protein